MLNFYCEQSSLPWRIQRNYFNYLNIYYLNIWIIPKNGVTVVTLILPGAACVLRVFLRFSMTVLIPIVFRVYVVKGSNAITGVLDAYLLPKYCKWLPKLIPNTNVGKCKIMAVEKQTKRKKTEIFKRFMQMNISTFFFKQILRLHRYCSP